MESRFRGHGTAVSYMASAKSLREEAESQRLYRVQEDQIYFIEQRHVMNR